MERLEVENCSQTKNVVFIAVLREKTLSKISLFFIFVCEDSRELLCCLYGAIFQFYVQKSLEDADASDLCGPAWLHGHVLSDALFACNGPIDKLHPRF